MENALSKNDIEKPSEENVGKIVVEGDLDSEKYGHIANQIMALQSYNVSKIIMEINSNGGEVSGIDKALQAINLCTVPIHTIVTGRCASSAYWLASQTDKIVALGANVQVGSIGVYSLMHSTNQYMKSIGVQEWLVVSEGSPKKIVTSEEEFRAQEQPVVNEIFNNFVKSVVKGRSTSQKDVLSKFGGGALLLARQAMDVGMIDAIFGETTTAEKLISIKEMQLPESIVDAQSLEVVTAKLEEKIHTKQKEAKLPMETVLKKTEAFPPWNQLSTEWQKDADMQQVGRLSPVKHMAETFYESHKRKLNAKNNTDIPRVF